MAKVSFVPVVGYMGRRKDCLPWLKLETETGSGQGNYLIHGNIDVDGLAKLWNLQGRYFEKRPFFRVIVRWAWHFVPAVMSGAGAGN